MEDDSTDADELSIGKQFFVMLAGSIVAFVAGKATEKLVTSALLSRQTSEDTEDQS